MRAFLAIFSLFNGVVLSLLALLAWLITTQAGLQFSVSQIQNCLGFYTEQQLKVEKIQGTWWNGFLLETVQWQQGDRVVQAAHVQFQANWSDLLQRNLQVHVLSAKAIRIQVPSWKKNSEPFSLPDQLRVPVNIELAQLKVGVLVFNDLQFNDIELKAQVKNAQLEVEKFALNSHSTAVNATLGMALEKPYRVNALATAQHRVDRRHADVTLRVQGTLEQLDLTLNGTAKNINRLAQAQSIQAQARVTPFVQGKQLHLRHLKIQDQHAVLEGGLTAGWSGKIPLHAQFKLTSINPYHYIGHASALWQGQLNGQVYFKGELAPGGKLHWMSPQGEFGLNLHHSTLANVPLILNAQVSGSALRLDRVLLNMDVLGNSVHMAGSYGKPSDALALNISLNELAKLGRLMNKEWAGSAKIQGRLRGTPSQFSAQGLVDVRQFRLDQRVQIDSMQGQFSGGSSPVSPWTGDMVVSKVKVPGASHFLLNNLALALRGTRNQHELKGVFVSDSKTFSRSRPIQGEFSFKGGIQNTQQATRPTAWQGALTAFRIEGLWSPARSLSLQGQAPLTLSLSELQLLGLVVQGEDASVIRNKQLHISSKEVHIEGEASQFTFPRLSPILRKQLTVEPNDLIVKARWNYRASANDVDGHVEISRVSGGLQVLDDAQVEIDLAALTASLDFNREATRMALNIQANKLGTVNASLSVPVEQNQKTRVWHVADNKAMQGTVAASFTQLNWFGPLISGAVRTTGTGQVAVAIGGTLNKPDVKGRLFAMGLNVFELDQGIRLEDGHVVVDFTTDKASIDTFDFTVYNRQPPRGQIEQLGPLIQGKGQISAQGQWSFTGEGGEIRLNMARVPLLQRPDRWTMLNADVLLQQPSAPGQALKVKGELNVLGSYIEMPKNQPQNLGNDVLIQGRSEVANPSLPVDLQVRANLGDQFYVNAQGLQSRLEGGVRLVMLDGVGGSGQRRSGRRLSATGTIQTVDGTYRAYGQDLSIERGVVNFQGPLENPGLNIRAVRKGLPVQAGVEVTGTAQRPRVALVSEPTVPDSEKLSWMILGRGSGSADRQASLLLAAVAAVFADQEESTTRKIAKSIGIDDLSFSAGSLTAADSRAVGSKVAIVSGADVFANRVGANDPLLSQRIVSLGKRLSNQVDVGFDYSLTTAASVLKFNYQLSRRLSVVARTGADNAVDILYQFSFD